jgi:hypothetical protein
MLAVTDPPDTTVMSPPAKPAPLLLESTLPLNLTSPTAAMSIAPPFPLPDVVMMFPAKISPSAFSATEPALPLVRAELIV